MPAFLVLLHKLTHSAFHWYNQFLTKESTQTMPRNKNNLLLTIKSISLLLIALSLITACTNQALPTPIPTDPLPTATALHATPTQIPPTPSPELTTVPTMEPEPSPEPTPEPSPTPMSFQGQVSLNKDNLNQVELLAMLGDGVVRDLAWSPDGKNLALCTMLGVDIFSINPFEKSQQLNQSIPCKAIDWSQTNQFLAIAIPEGEIQLWDTDQWALLNTLESQFDDIHGIALSSSGKNLAIGSNQGEVKIMKLNSSASNEEDLLISSHVYGKVLVAWSPDEKSLVSANEDGRLVVWDAQSGELIILLDGHDAPINGMAWSADSKTLASSSQDYQIKLWDFQEKSASHAFSGTGPLVWNPDKDVLYFNHEGTLSSQAIIEDSQAKALSNEPVYAILLSLSADTKQLALINEHGSLLIINSQTGKAEEVYTQYSLPITDIASSPDGSQYASLSADGTLSLWDSKTGEQIHRLDGMAISATQLAWSPDGKFLAFEGDNGQLRLFELESQSVAHDLKPEFPANIGSIAWSPDSQVVSIGQTSGNISLWDVNTATEIPAFQTHADTVGALAWHPQIDQFTAGDDLGILRVWEPSGRRVLKRLESHAASIFDIAYAPDASLLATASADGFIFLWDVQSMEILHKLDASGCQVNRIAWAESGDFLASVDSCGNLRIWDPQSGQALHILKDNDKPLYGLSLTANGQTILTSGLDGVIRVWGIR